MRTIKKLRRNAIVLRADVDESDTVFYYQDITPTPSNKDIQHA